MRIRIISVIVVAHRNPNLDYIYIIYIRPMFVAFDRIQSIVLVTSNMFAHVKKNLMAANFVGQHV